MIPITIESLLMVFALGAAVGAYVAFWLGIRSERRLWLRSALPMPSTPFTDPEPLLDAPIGASWPTTNDRTPA